MQESISLNLACKIDALCRKFERAWKAEQAPRILEFVADVPQKGKSSAVRELIAQEVDLRRAAGETVDPGEYRERLPQYADAVTDAFALLDRNADMSDGVTRDYLVSKNSPRAGEGRSDEPAARPAFAADTELPRDTHSPAGVPRQQGGHPRRFGNYELLEKLGEGGMGVVYKARQLTADRLVALKLIRPDRLARILPEQRESALARFRNEVQAASQLDHDHVVTVYDVGEVDGQPYYVMRFVEGHSLREHVNEHPMVPEEAARYMQQVAEALVEAHGQGILHRDLKPHNVLIDGKADRALLADFGLAKLTEADQQLTETESPLGSPPYMSPEQTGDARNVDVASDIYGVGATLYHLLTGRPPFQAANFADTLIQVRTQEPVSPRVVNPAVPKDLETITLKCLEKEPRKRYGSAAALAAELNRFRRGEPIMARPISQPEVFWRWCKRNPTLAALTSTIAVLLVAGIVVASLVNLRLGKQQTELKRANSELFNKTHQLTRALKRAESEETLASVRSYSARIVAAQQAWQNDNAALAWHYLESCHSDLRGWEHDYLRTLFNRNQLTLYGHGHHVTCVAFSRDGKRIVSGSSTEDGTIKVWDATTGVEILALKGHTATITSVAFAPDGQRIVSGSRDNTIRVWDVTTGEATRFTERGHIEIDSEVWCVAFSSDGERIVSGGRNRPAEVTKVRLWNAATGEEIRRLGVTNSVSAIAFSPDGQRIVGGSQFPYVWDATTGETICVLQGHTSTVISVAFSPDGQRIVSGGHDNTIRVWNATTGEHLLTLDGHTAAVSSVAFSPDGQRIVSGGNDNTIRVWNAAKGEEAFTLIGHTAEVLSVAFSPNGQRIVSGSSDGTLKVWDTTRGAARNPAARRIVIRSEDQTLKVWNFYAGEEPVTMRGNTNEINSAAVSPDGRRIVLGVSQRIRDLGDNSRKVAYKLEFWDTLTGSKVLSLIGPAYTLRNVAFSRDGRRIIGGGYLSRSKTGRLPLKVWDASTGKELLTLQGHFRGFSLDGRRIVTDSLGMLNVWDADTGEQTLTLKARSVYRMAFSPDGRWIASAHRDNTLRVWNADTGTEHLTLEGHAEPLRCVAYSPDGRHVVSGSEDKTIKVWDANTGKAIHTLTGHTGSVNSVAFSPDGQRIVSGSSDKTVKVWHPATGEELLTLRGHVDAIQRVFFDAGGLRLASCTGPLPGSPTFRGDFAACIWDATAGVWTNRPWPGD